jgi:hypothetical protein
MSSNVTAGLAVTAVNSAELNTSTFDFVRVASNAAADSDGDGLPDSYEMANGLNKNDPNDAGQDADGDRMSNLQEYLAGTNPQNSNSVFRITRFNWLSNNLVLSFLGGTGKIYAIERGTNLPIMSWQTVTNVGSGTNTSVTVTNFSGPASSNGFFRVRVVP